MPNVLLVWCTVSSNSLEHIHYIAYAQPRVGGSNDHVSASDDASDLPHCCSLPLLTAIPHSSEGPNIQFPPPLLPTDPIWPGLVGLTQRCALQLEDVRYGRRAVSNARLHKR